MNAAPLGLCKLLVLVGPGADGVGPAKRSLSRPLGDISCWIRHAIFSQVVIVCQSAVFAGSIARQICHLSSFAEERWVQSPKGRSCVVLVNPTASPGIGHMATSSRIYNTNDTS